MGQLARRRYYAFAKDRLTNIELSFGPESYVPLVRAFTAKLGPPDSTWTTEWRNRLGASFDNPMVAWRDSRSVLQLRMYASTLDWGTGTLTPLESPQATEQAEDSAAERAKKDL